MTENLNITIPKDLENLAFTIEKVHIDTVRRGDTVIHDGKVMTVGKNNVRRGGFFGTSLFGDSYHSGYRPVLLVRFTDPRPARL